MEKSSKGGEEVEAPSKDFFGEVLKEFKGNLLRNPGKFKNFPVA